LFFLLPASVICIYWGYTIGANETIEKRKRHTIWKIYNWRGYFLWCL